MRLSDFALLLLLSLLWGANFLFIRIGVESIPPTLFVGLRLALAVPILYAVLRVKLIALPRDVRTWASLACLGLFNAALPYSLFAWGEQYIPSSLAAIHNSTTPLWTVILAQIWVREERLTPLRSLGIVLGFAGVVWLVSDSAQSLLDGNLLGQLAALGASACYAISALFARRRLHRLPPQIQAFGQLATGMLWLLPLILLSPETYSTQPSIRSLLALGALSIISTACGLLIFFALLRRVGASRTTQVTYLLPVFAIFWGWLVLAESIEPHMIGGFAIILLGVLAVNGRLPLRRLPKLSTSNPQCVDEQTFDSARSCK